MTIIQGINAFIEHKKIHFHYGAGGALVCDTEIPGVTHDLLKENDGDDTARFYGGRYFIAESMMKSTAQKISELLGGVLDE
mgnify:CR=1 FL=1